MTCELRIFYHLGYESKNIPEETCLQEVSDCRFDFARVRAIRLIDWSMIRPNGDTINYYDWKSPRYTNDGRDNV